MPQISPSCPLQEASCDIITELVGLREQVSELSELVHTDTLTGLSNFRYFMQALEQEMERTRRTGHATGLIMVDLDYFKKVNDEWGHDVGNKALILASSLIKASVRKMDAPCRYGGEEFAIILPSTDRQHSILVAERARELIASTPLEFDGNEIMLTASFGVDIFTGVERGCAEEMVKRADGYLYKAKESGRNRVCIAPVEEKIDNSSVNQDEKDALFGLFGRASNLSDSSY
ncbi:GGDEF domain-containing protein [Alkalimarinus alittae]|uniref:diguanylate cyclase n=1 Tax=Alkalimarinus alittae TaxID=2961619 RepID=A0ABY6N3J7_9ALTE|nr:GGDEF domain-containing protein [Alkalimarinus alittae]UZE96687.1 GGDEF domain-containing protein [Alkalimarinus alittae]